jgi:hypothetical protein
MSSKVQARRACVIICVILLLLVFPALGGVLLWDLTSLSFCASLIIAFFGSVAVGAIFTGVHTWIRSISNSLKGIY